MSHGRLSATEEAALAAFDGAVESGQHDAVRIVVEVEHNARKVGILEFCQSHFAGQFNHHARWFGITYGSLEIHIPQRTVSTLFEETNGASVFKVVHHIVVGSSRMNFYDKAVKRIVVTTPHADGVPAVATLHLAVNAHHGSLFCKGRLFVFVLHAQEFKLTL